MQVLQAYLLAVSLGMLSQSFANLQSTKNNGLAINTGSVKLREYRVCLNFTIFYIRVNKRAAL